MSEANLMRRLQVYASKLGARVFRNNVGMAYLGTPQRIRATVSVTLHAGDLVLRKYRVIKFGLGEGSSDLIGWQSVTITPEMVGKKIATFTALEVKTEDGETTAEQSNFIAAVKSSGGIAGEIRTEEDTKNLLTPEL